MRKRTLSLKREALTELTNTELDQVVGGSGLSCINCNSDFQQCITGVDCLPTSRCFTGTIQPTQLCQP
jgi:bacteriocin-like protein